ncbi:UDP-glucose 4-epimerase GalE [Lichenihabitans sp. Uapishka_5]|uniref:UDP-glucose 4-epimerase GalE n=1 Tax=Lichenihabitans sp. Uapishka_5 TaxID=3037302 RepID=UPI0029E7FB5C|nr:UDP-glucose 4-epimerase GalE [Lichenihabitans sp. Uapishka_5]MDX7951594.1 UDP-glucose 4-epimerase GalE [Lichenihabitans sp. Uapishka_5]
MAVLVTGGAGYIGSHMVLALQDAGDQAVVLDNLSTGFRSAVGAAATFIEGDFGDQALVERIIATHGITAIAHFAAKIVVPESVADPLGYYLNNTAKARNLIAAAVATGVRHFIFSSTAAVYGDASGGAVGEDAPLAPMSPYGRSKLMVEWMLADTAAAHDLRYVVLRYFNVAGADPAGRAGQSTRDATHLIKVAVQAALGRRPGMSIFGMDYDTPDGTCLRDYIQVSDLAQAHRDALAYLRAGHDSHTFNCGYGQGYSVRQVVDVVKAASGVDFPVTMVPRRAGDPPAIVADNSRIKAVLGWRPRYDDLSAIVTQALDWERRLHNQRP